MDATYTTVASRLRQALSLSNHQRILVAVAGPPGSGKTVVADGIIKNINNENSAEADQPANSIASLRVPVDGFHYTRRYLDRLANQRDDQLQRGAPWAFDVDALIKFVEKLKRSAQEPKEARSTITAPSFDQALGDPVDGGFEIAADVNIVMLVGSYLLLDMQRWREVSRLVDITIFVDTDAKIARSKVAAKLVESGIEETHRKAMDKIDESEHLNGDLLRKNLVPVDIKVEKKDPPA